MACEIVAAVCKLSTVPAVDWVLHGSGESIMGGICGSLDLRLAPSRNSVRDNNNMHAVRAEHSSSVWCASPLLCDLRVFLLCFWS